jgi:phage terminase large subunit
MTEVVRQATFRFQPRPYQRDFLAAFPKAYRRAALVWHRRAGKDLTVYNMMATQAMQDPPGLYYFIYPSYAQGKKILWNGMDKAGVRYLDYTPAEAADPAARNESDMQQWFRNGSLIQVVGCDKIDSLVGTNPKGLAYSEYSLESPRAWDLMEPILLENGGWAVFLYTPRGRNHGYRLYQGAVNNAAEWYASLLTVHDTRRADGSYIVSPAQIDSLRRNGRSEVLIQQEYYCSFDGEVEGAYYDLRDVWAEGRVGDFPWNPTKPVETAWDIGTGDTTVVIFYQQNGPWIDVIDVAEASNRGVDYWAKLVNSKPYVYTRLHHGPWDLQQRQWGNRAQTVVSIAAEYGLHFHAVDKCQIEDGIAAVRRILPRLRFHRTPCYETLFYGHTFLDAIAAYHKEWDEDKECYVAHPHHDWASHAADALRVLGQAVRIALDLPVQQTRTDTRWNPFSPQADEPQYEQDGVADWYGIYPR